MSPKQESTAKREGFKILGDQDLLNGVENRARQLEAERSGHMLFKTEAEALGDEATADQHAAEIAKLDKRLNVVHARRDALKANIDAAGGDKGNTPAGQ